MLKYILIAITINLFIFTTPYTYAAKELDRKNADKNIKIGIVNCQFKDPETGVDCSNKSTKIKTVNKSVDKKIPNGGCGGSHACGPGGSSITTPETINSTKMKSIQR